MTRQVTVISGSGRWAYWVDPIKGQVIADTVCNHMAGHFAGQLGGEWTSPKPGVAELHTDGFIPERARSVFDVEDE